MTRPSQTWASPLDVGSPEPVVLDDESGDGSTEGCTILRRDALRAWLRGLRGRWARTTA